MNELYPTPKKVIDKMLERITIEPSTILEPSAGKGDLLNGIINKFGNSLEFGRRYRDLDVYYMEKDPLLQPYLMKEYDNCMFLGSDFLSLDSGIYFDLIIMNPPFNHGADHLLKAWNVLKHGEVVCLINSETYNNTYSKKRQLLKNIIDEHGSIEELGQCFEDSERKTSVNVSLVYLKKESESEFTYLNDLKIGDNENSEKSEVRQDEIITKNQVQAYVRSFELAKKHMINAYKEMQKAVHYSRSIREDYCYNNPFKDGMKKIIDSFSLSSNYDINLRKAINNSIPELKANAWNKIVQLSKFSNIMSKSVKDKFTNEINKRSAIEFTEENINIFLETLINNAYEIANESMLDVFDRFCAYHKKNKIHYEGWKSNSAYKINKRVILPNFINYDSYGYGIIYHTKSSLDDFDRVICSLDGKKLSDIRSIKESLVEQFEIVKGREDNKDKSAQSTYFDIKFFKKGTVHLTFRDSKLRDRLNIEVGRKRQWLPPTEDKIEKEKRIEHNGY
jgi:hypothetical protein